MFNSSTSGREQEQASKTNEAIIGSIVAVHGLGADPKHTWECLPKSHSDRSAKSTALRDVDRGRICVHWLRDFLAEDFPNARVMTFGYNADWFVRSPTATVYERAGTLLKHLRDARVQQPVRLCSRFALQGLTFLSFVPSSSLPTASVVL
jgi:hypothetical protein